MPWPEVNYLHTQWLSILIGRSVTSASGLDDHLMWWLLSQSIWAVWRQSFDTLHKATENLLNDAWHQKRWSCIQVVVQCLLCFQFVRLLRLAMLGPDSSKCISWHFFFYTFVSLPRHTLLSQQCLLRLLALSKTLTFLQEYIVWRKLAFYKQI